MQIRPWPVVIIAFYYLLTPVINIFFNAWVHSISPELYLNAVIYHMTAWKMFIFLLSYPICSVALFLYKKWSYYLFLAIAIMIFTENIMEYLRYPNIIQMPVLLTIEILNIAVITYFFLPFVRAPYFNPRMRWWESKPRYLLEIPCLVHTSNAEQRGDIGDFSQGGVFVRGDSLPELGEKVEVSFQAFNIKLRLPATVVHVREVPLVGYGLEFVGLNQGQKRSIKDLLKKIKINEVPQAREKPKLIQNFTEWVSGLFRSTMKKKN